MKSGKQRRKELATARKTKVATKARKAKRDAAETRLQYIADHVLAGAVPVNPKLLAPNSSRDEPEFVARGTYLDLAFACVDCGLEQIWTATQQKWWYEVAKGGVHTRANRCRACRRRERARKTEARRVHLDGVAKKKGT